MSQEEITAIVTTSSLGPFCAVSVPVFSAAAVVSVFPSVCVVVVPLPPHPDSAVIAANKIASIFVVFFIFFSPPIIIFLLFSDLTHPANRFQ